MDNKPITLSRKEMKEIAAIETIRDSWGAQDATEMEAMLDETVYAVKKTRVANVESIRIR